MASGGRVGGGGGAQHAQRQPTEPRPHRCAVVLIPPYRGVHAQTRFSCKKPRNPLRTAAPQGRRFVEELWRNCERERKSWWLTFHGATRRLVQSRSPAVKSDTEPIAMTAVGLHDRIVNQYRPRHRMCSCCWPTAQAADCWKIVNAYGVSDMVVLQLGPLRQMLTSQLVATRRQAATGPRECYGRAQPLETVRMV